jgi:hypothetical protein
MRCSEAKIPALMIVVSTILLTLSALIRCIGQGIRSPKPVKTAVRHKVKKIMFFRLTTGAALGLIGEMERLERNESSILERESGSGRRWFEDSSVRI